VTATTTQPGPGRVRLLDVVWLALYAALALGGPRRTAAATQVLIGLAVLQLIESRIEWFSSATGRVYLVLLKLFLAWLLIGVTGGITSSYYLILMAPVVAAATALGALGTMAVSLLASASYLSFLLWVDWGAETIPPDQIRELALRVLLFCILALLMSQLADASRARARQQVETAVRLAEANRNLEMAEAAVRRSERLAALGQLTAGLAHELLVEEGHGPRGLAEEGHGGEQHCEGTGRTAHGRSFLRGRVLGLLELRLWAPRGQAPASSGPTGRKPGGAMGGEPGNHGTRERC